MPSNKPFGALPARSLTGGSVPVNRYPVGASTTINIGDFVTLTSSGTVTAAAAGDTLIGVSAEYVATGAGETSTVMVYDDPTAIFMVQCSGSAAQTNIGNNADIVANSGSSLGISKHTLDVSTFATTSAQLRVLGKANLPNNDWGNYVIVDVVINEHYYKQTTGV